MKPLESKTIFAILIAAMFCFCVIYAIEGGANFLHMLVGFVVAFGVTFVVMYMRFAPLVIAAAVVLILGCYGAIKAGWGSAGIGAFCGIATVMLLQFGWVGPHMKEGTTAGAEDYMKQQKAIHEQEKAGGGDYAAQQRALYEQEKAKKAAEAGGGAPKAPGA